MDKEASTFNDQDAFRRGFHLLEDSASGGVMTVRDDQHEFSWILDAVKRNRRWRGRFRLVDTGRFDRYQLEWFLGAGSDLYTSDDMERGIEELDSLQKTARGAGAVVVNFIKGEISDSEESSRPSLAALSQLGLSGVDLHLTNRELERDLDTLGGLGLQCRDGGGWLVYYHHGPVLARLSELADRGAKIHIAELDLSGEESSARIMDVVRRAAESGNRLILHVGEGMESHELELRDLAKAGAHLAFKTHLIEFTSPLKRLVEASRKRKLDFRAYYLYESFFP